MENNPKEKLGSCGEDLAAVYVRNQGYYILIRNYRCRLGEIDIIAKKNGCLTFFEVKTRTGDEFGTPAESVTVSKMHHIRRVAEYFMSRSSVKYNWVDFQVIEITVSKIDGISL